MQQKDSTQKDRSSNTLNVTIAGLAAQVGCLTLVVVLAAAFGGLWLDKYFNTRPILTIILLLASIPLSVWMMLSVVRAATAKIKASLPAKTKGTEEEKFGDDKA